MSRQNNERVPCPRCRANNFIGQAQCWQCRAPLPPPESLSAPQRPRAQSQRPVLTPPPSPIALPPQFNASVAPRPQNRTGFWGILVGVAALAFLLVFFVANRGRRGETPDFPATTSHRATTSTLSSERVPAVLPEASRATPHTEEDDPETAQAKREIDRFRKENGIALPSNATSPDGRVHLRSGGSISPEEWEAARRKVQESPLLRDPPPPPPF